MATCIWQGGATAVAQQVRLTPGGTIEADDRFKVTIGDRTLDVAAGGTTAADVVDALAAAWSAAGPEFAELTVTDEGDTLLVEAATAGVPFTLVLATTEAGGGAADDQTFQQSTVRANAGPYCWDTASNWSTGTVPTTGDTVIFENSSIDCLYGLDQASVTLAALRIRQSYTGTIGLPRVNASGYTEHRPTYLAIGALLIDVGLGDGAGSGRIKIDTGSALTSITVRNTGTPLETGIGAMVWKGTHVSNTLTAIKGSISIAPFGDETANLSTLIISYAANQAGDVTLRCGDGLTLSTVSVYGGSALFQNNITTLAQYGGTVEVLGAATITTATLFGGTLKLNGTGTITTLNVHNGAMVRKNVGAQEITNVNLYAGFGLSDPMRLITASNGYTFHGCAPSDGTFDIGRHLIIGTSEI